MKKKFLLSITLLFGVGLIWAQEPAICVHEEDKEFSPFESDPEVIRIAESFSWNEAVFFMRENIDNIS